MVRAAEGPGDVHAWDGRVFNSEQISMPTGWHSDQLNHWQGMPLLQEGQLMRRAVGYLVILIVAGAASAAAQDAKVQGEKVFADQKCSLCHSIGGKGNAKGPLDQVGSKLSADDIRAWLTDAKGMTAKTKATRKPEMKEYTLPKADVDTLVVYLSAMKK
jgi:mono/diheme cytochrome c family protein